MAHPTTRLTPMMRGAWTFREAPAKPVAPKPLRLRARDTGRFRPRLSCAECGHPIQHSEAKGAGVFCALCGSELV